jgi:predicted negative regulator of RcsB-dependent stress response
VEAAAKTTQWRLAMKLVKLIVVVAIIIVGVVLWKNYSSKQPTEQTVASQPGERKPMKDEDKPRLEEKYGFTSEQVSP